MVNSDDGKWRLRAIHLGTNTSTTPPLDKVRRTRAASPVSAEPACSLTSERRTRAQSHQ
jgi:hypothetical protein